MRFSIAFSGLLAATAVALPGDGLFKRAACNADNCLRAVRATNAAPGSASASADCNSFFRSTVSACSATTTTTSTSTITETTTSTKFGSGGTTTETYTATATTTTTVTVTAGNGVAKRAACTTTTVTPSSVPTYASACSGTSRYSSACSCNGATRTATTVFSGTSTVTATATTTTTSLSVTLYNPITTETTTTTTTTTVTATTTVQPVPTFAFTLSIASGTGAGKIGHTVLSQSSGNVIVFGDQAATPFSLRSDSVLQWAQGPFAVNSASDPFDGPAGNDVISQYTAPANSVLLHCSLNIPAGSTATSGSFTCAYTLNNGFTETVFNYCDTNANEPVKPALYLTLDDNSCPEVTLSWTKV